ncbi:MAG: GNAT family N-acetyltransferase [Candidatus Electrothrix sp. ATG2]|nr:GNAT family N-acetyltransferase [Candidatus Electrothrix sp. ATG2]
MKLNKKLADFYASLVEEFSATHQCQINLLKIDDDCVAAQFCLINQGTLHILKIGYDEAFDDVAPGSLLLFDLLNRCSDDPNVQFISFVTGPPWTKRWHADSHTVYEALFFNKSLKGYLAVSLYKLKSLISSTLHKEKT